MVIAYAAERQFMVMVSLAFHFLAHGTGHERRRDRPRCHGRADSAAEVRRSLGNLRGTLSGV